jgi:DNA-binding MarR family transcriptional regulator
MSDDRSPIDPEVAEFTGQLFFRLWRAHHTRTAEALDSIELSPPLFALLNVLGAGEGEIQQQIGARMGIDRSTMVTLIDELEARGLAERRPHPADRRAREVAITAAGRHVLRRAREMVLGVEGEVLHALTAAERDELTALLRRALAGSPPQTPWSAQEGD